MLTRCWATAACCALLQLLHILFLIPPPYLLLSSPIWRAHRTLPIHPACAVQVRTQLCSTLSGNRCELLTITDFSSPLEAIRQRECVMFTSRVHPGETCASWIIQVRARGLSLRCRFAGRESDRIVMMPSGPGNTQPIGYTELNHG